MDFSSYPSEKQLLYLQISCMRDGKQLFVLLLEVGGLKCVSVIFDSWVLPYEHFCF